MIAFCQARFATFAAEEAAREVLRKKKAAHTELKDALAWNEGRNLILHRCASADDPSETLEVRCKYNYTTGSINEDVWHKVETTVNWARINSKPPAERAPELYKALQAARRKKKEAAVVSLPPPPPDPNSLKRKRRRRIQFEVEEDDTVRRAAAKYNALSMEYSRLFRANRQAREAQLQENPRLIEDAKAELLSKEGRTRKLFASSEHGIDFILSLETTNETVFPKAAPLKDIVAEAVQACGDGPLDRSVLPRLVAGVKKATTIKTVETLTLKPQKTKPTEEVDGDFGY